MSRPIVIDPRAEQEIADAYAWYRRQSSQAAARFRVEMNKAVVRIGEQSTSFPAYLHDTRRCLLNKFPYLVVFREYPDHLFLIAVAYGHRRPGYWRNRVP